MKTEKINLREVTIHNLDGSVFSIPADHIPKSLGDMLYMNSEKIDQEDLARKIHACNTCEVDEEQLNWIISLVASRPVFNPLITRKIMEYLNQKLENVKTE